MNESLAKLDSQDPLGISADDHHVQSLQSRQASHELLSLASHIFHDVNNCLLIIQFASEKLLRGLSSDDANYSTLIAIEEARQNAAHLTRQFRDAKETMLRQAQCVDLNKLVRRWEPLILGMIRENVILNLDLTSRPAMVMVRQETVERILLHLILCALAVISDGGWLNIHTSVTDDDNSTSSDASVLIPHGFVRLRISDTGCDDAASSGCHVNDGGLLNGLEKAAIRRSEIEMVGKIVGDFGGQFSVTSSDDSGTKVDIFLPEIPAECVQPSKTVDHPEAATGRETILLVDDEPHVRHFIKHALESYGYKVIEAHDGCSAMRLASEHADSLHLLVTDLQLNGASGHELADRLRSDYPGLPVIFISGMACDNSALDANSSFLEKPFKPIALITIVRRLLDVRRSEARSSMTSDK